MVRIVGLLRNDHSLNKAGYWLLLAKITQSDGC
jgi:hypothetical protein